jgi:CRISPR-associated endonuclease/helicase Cas3
MIFQEALSVPDDIKSRPSGLMAKAPELNRYSRPGFRHYSRPGFRHELATAIAMLQNGLPDLAAYLAAAHHGKVRLSIRSLPNETHPDNPDTRFARGVWDRDTMPGVSLGGKTDVPQTILDLSYMELGESETTGASWLARMTVLRDSQGIGPFRLTLMEALLRVADWRAGLSEGGVE